MTERSGVEIDYCPRCRGVWLDRGELDKIIEQSESQPNQVQSGHAESSHHATEKYNANGKPFKAKRGSFLGDMLGNFGGED